MGLALMAPCCRILRLGRDNFRDHPLGAVRGNKAFRRVASKMRMQHFAAQVLTCTGFTPVLSMKALARIPYAHSSSASETLNITGQNHHLTSPWSPM